MSKLYNSRLSKLKDSKKTIVITGSPCSGKTTTIEGFRQLGYPVLDEISTIMLQTGWHPAKNGRHNYQREVLRRQVEAETQLSQTKKGPYFVDRGLLDGIAFYRLDNIEISDMFDQLDLSHYAGVFVLEQLGTWVDNGIRFENLEFAQKFEPVIENVYRERGFPVIKVPPISIEERIDFVLAETAKLLG